jgi:predicted phage baseplate assembly protein
MSLQPIALDTLTWDQMVSAIRTRIPADSNGKWTLHAPVDPGVTLIELYAWLLEQRVYWMDQTPDDLIYATLALLGEAPKPARPAVTLLRLIDDSAPPASFRVVSSGTAMRLGQTNPPLIFTTDTDVTLLPMDEDAAVGLRVNGIDRSNDLKQGRPVLLLGKEATSVQADFLFSLTTKVISSIQGKFGFLVELDESSGIPPQWSNLAAGVPDAATLVWSYRGGTTGTITPFAPDQVEDGTSSLRRSGVVRLPLPGDWQPESSTGSNGETLYSIVLQISDAKYSASPQIVRLVPNIVPAHHRLARTKTPSTSEWPSLPGNVIALTNDPTSTGLKEFPPIEDTVKVRLQEQDQTYQWVSVESLFSSGPADRSFIVDRQRGEVSFGDGLTGRLPLPVGALGIEVSYEAGGGTAGLVGENLDWEGIDISNSGSDLKLRGTNVIAGQEGMESESLAEAQQRVRAGLSERVRAVAAVDFENLAQTTPGVGFRRAKAAIGYHPDFPCTTIPGVVTVFVVPFAPRAQLGLFGQSDDFIAAPEPDPGALAAASKRMEGARLLGTQVYVLAPKYRKVRLGVQATTASGISATLQAKMRGQLQEFLDPLSGGDDGAGWPFGGPLRPTALLREAQETLGDAGSVLSVSIQLEGMQTPESCNDVALGAYELPVLTKVEFQIQKTAALAGGLR